MFCKWSWRWPRDLEHGSRGDHIGLVSSHRCGMAALNVMGWGETGIIVRLLLVMMKRCDTMQGGVVRWLGH